MPDPKQDLLRHARLIEPMLERDRATASFPNEDASTVQVERGVVFAHALASCDSANLEPVDRLIELAGSGRIAEFAIVDAQGHRRAEYRGLLVCSWLQAFRILYETLPQDQFGRWEEASRAWSDMLESELGQLELPAGALPASHASTAVNAAMTALALHVAGKVFVRDAWIDLASHTFGKLTRAQQSDGAYFLAGSSDNPETRWYYELVMLHAAASYAVQTEDRPVAASVLRSTAFLHAEIQPDHATNQPWALFPFIWNPATRGTADHMLHTTSALQSGESSGLSLMLLADALYCLRLFEKPQP